VTRLNTGLATHLAVPGNGGATGKTALMLTWQGGVYADADIACALFGMHRKGPHVVSSMQLSDLIESLAGSRRIKPR